jgi:riboflavin kinase/FMN adenylyltransferase
MILIEGLEKIVEPFKNAVITIGNFDGVHLGHQALFRQVIKKAQALAGTSVAMTFEPHPIRVLKKNGNPPLITVFEQKQELIAKTGIDVLICVPFTREFAAITATEFVQDTLMRRIGMKAMVIGEDYAFGRNREGDFDFLRKQAGRMGFELSVAGWIPVSNNGTGRISSTRVREMIMAGEVDQALYLLGRFFQIRGRVVTGRNRGGKLLGFPTANLLLSDELCPKTGIYAVTVELQGETLQGVANIGYSPTFDDNIYTVEVYILDFNRNIYGQDIRVNFIQRIRDEAKFAGIEALADQIRLDVVQARQILDRLR